MAPVDLTKVTGCSGSWQSSSLHILWNLMVLWFRNSENASINKLHSFVKAAWEVEEGVYLP